MLRVALVTVSATAFLAACGGVGAGAAPTATATPSIPVATAAPTPVRTGPAPTRVTTLVDDPSVGIGWSFNFYPAFPSDDESTRRADLIVIATVDPPGDPFWTTLDGQRPGVTVEGKLPELPPDQLRWGTSPQIFTPWTFTVGRTLKGRVPESGPVVVNVLGGAIPPDEVINDGEQFFESGDEIVLFLKDCGPRRAEKYGTPYRFVNRHVVAPDGTARGFLPSDPVLLPELLGVIERERDRPPLAEVSCG